MVYSVPKTVRSNLKLGKVESAVSAAGALVGAGAKVVSGVVRHTKKPKPKTQLVPLDERRSLPIHPGEKPGKGSSLEEKAQWVRKAREFNASMSDQNFVQTEQKKTAWNKHSKQFDIKNRVVGHQTFSNDFSRVAIPGRPARIEAYRGTTAADIRASANEGQGLKNMAARASDRNLSAQQAAINKRLS
jgi:hypothetical protein